ncbi:MAG: hypothetical protein HUJ68_02070 [Clostridia bacterium]|nr:hypothetical protein [Clostridia bacterium]
MEKQQQNQNTKSVKITRNIALPMLIITVISLSTLIICTLIAVGVIIANSIQTKEQ